MAERLPIAVSEVGEIKEICRRLLLYPYTQKMCTMLLSELEREGSTKACHLFIDDYDKPQLLLWHHSWNSRSLLNMVFCKTANFRLAFLRKSEDTSVKLTFKNLIAYICINDWLNRCIAILDSVFDSSLSQPCIIKRNDRIIFRKLINLTSSWLNSTSAVTRCNGCYKPIRLDSLSPIQKF